MNGKSDTFMEAVRYATEGCILKKLYSLSKVEIEPMNEDYNIVALACDK
jgi:hypothetical protein